MSYCGECYYEGKKLKPCSTCYCGSEAKTEWTNADKIRAMSDEELAEYLVNFKALYNIIIMLTSLHHPVSFPAPS